MTVKKHTFSNYFVISGEKLFSINNFNFEDNLENCFYIKKLGSNHKPIIYLDTKVDGKWINRDQIIGNYDRLMDFIVANKNSYICIRGFSRAVIGQFIRMINELGGTNIKPVEFGNKLQEIKYERHLLTKEQRVQELTPKFDTIGDIEIKDQHMTTGNSVSEKKKHKSKVKIIQFKK